MQPCAKNQHKQKTAVQLFVVVLQQQQEDDDKAKHTNTNWQMALYAAIWKNAFFLNKNKCKLLLKNNFQALTIKRKPNTTFSIKMKHVFKNLKFLLLLVFLFYKWSAKSSFIRKKRFFCVMFHKKISIYFISFKKKIIIEITF